MNTALQLSRRLPATFDALAAGRLDWPKVQAITETTATLPEATATRVEQAVLPDASTQNVPALRRALAAAVGAPPACGGIAADPAAAAERAKQAWTGRRVVFSPAQDGMCELWALLPAEGTIRAKTGLDILARAARTPGDARTADQRRADTLIDLLATATRTPCSGPGNPDPAHVTDAGSADPAPSPDAADAARARVGGAVGAPGSAGRACMPVTPVRRPPEVLVTVSLDTLLGLTEDPGHLAGYGPVVADLAREVAARGTWRCAVIDGTHGTLLGLGRATYTPDYRPGQPLADHIAARDRTCTFPGCHQPAHRCDNDHRTPHPDGPTCECNLAALCRHHHRLKHQAGFHVHASTEPTHPPGSLTWTTRTGREYLRPPTRITAGTRERPPPDYSMPDDPPPSSIADATPPLSIADDPPPF